MNNQAQQAAHLLDEALQDYCNQILLLCGQTNSVNQATYNLMGRVRDLVDNTSVDSRFNSLLNIKKLLNTQFQPETREFRTRVQRVLNNSDVRLNHIYNLLNG